MNLAFRVVLGREVKYHSSVVFLSIIYILVFINVCVPVIIEYIIFLIIQKFNLIRNVLTHE